MRELPGRIGRRECHLQRGPLAVEVELEALTAADEASDGAAESVLVGLEPVPDTRLHDALAVLELRHENEQRVEVVGVEVVRADRHDPAEEQRPEAGRWVDRQHAASERDAASRRVPRLWNTSSSATITSPTLQAHVVADLRQRADREREPVVEGRQYSQGQVRRSCATWRAQGGRLLDHRVVVDLTFERLA